MIWSRNLKISVSHKWSFHHKDRARQVFLALSISKDNKMHLYFLLFSQFKNTVGSNKKKLCLFLVLHYALLSLFGNLLRNHFHSKTSQYFKDCTALYLIMMLLLQSGRCQYLLPSWTFSTLMNLFRSTDIFQAYFWTGNSVLV